MPGKNDRADPDGTSPGSNERVARDIMRADPARIGPQHTLARAAQLMESSDVRELPVVVDGAALVGLVTRTDLEPHRGHFEWTLVSTAMTPKPITVLPDTPVRTVAQLLRAKGFNSVPVAENGILLGMITAKDLVGLLAG